ncbi:hypothetical protein CCP3SC1AL1_570018 [Gammaproteobacteria bacterium]
MREREFNQRQGKIDAKSQPANIYGAWQDLNNPKKKAGLLSPVTFTKTWGETPETSVVDNRGKELNLTGFKVTTPGKYFTDGKGVRRIITTVDVPIEDAKRLGIFSEKGSTINKAELSNEGAELLKLTQGGESLKGSDNGIAADFLGKAVVRGSGDKGIVQVTTSLPIDPKNQAMEELFNSHSGPAKMVPALEGDNTSNSQPKQNHPPITQNGFTYTWNPKINDYE